VRRADNAQFSPVKGVPISKSESTSSSPRSPGPPLFPSGQIVATPSALDAVSQQEINAALSRHLHGDWGNCDPEDAAENELALAEGFRLFSVYQTQAGTKFWIITEADRSATTILLPADY
jgi:hypothetical protein